MDKAQLEVMAEIQGKDLDDVLYNLTRTSTDELENALSEHIERLESPSKIKRNRIAGEKFIDWFEENEKEKIGETEVQDFLTDIVKQGYSKNYVKQIYYGLKKFIEKHSDFSATTASQIATVSCAEVTKQAFSTHRTDDQVNRMGDGSRPITEDEIDAMVAVAPTFRTKIMVDIFAHTGFRAEELATLRMDDIDLQNRELTVDTGKRKHEQHRRTVQIPLRISQQIRKYIETERPRYGRESDYLFLTLKSDHPYPHNIARTIRDTAEKAGIQEYAEMQNGAKRAEITPHSFRKYTAIRLDKEGYSVKEVAEFLGHGDLQSVSDYYDIQ